ncbi:2-keto-4-pentenoate hydratase [Staphylococcus carnosus]|uniref:2-keto-4-pentenoate hydratase n=1 Tax=Staphylococcus carnosus TaxID=1281 RepID=UPI00081A527B|nr:2-keto-4-pentenoate hydratase [Staphylococcus carnosus]ANZ34287.1 2-keto-4-pentenoate hydratase [Staphylococcus carnosus]UTB81659.1 2-keto-4-pentenoate hydratase [Staphylococcus carnosus]UTB86477.1 2-keto-4-pentenoate hydratase [Staphylococcus carnosus]
MTQYKKEIINTLFKAQQNHEPVEFISKTYEVEEPVAYHIQDELISELKKANNSEVAGYKVSMTSDETQAYADTDEPAYGTILSDKVVESGDTVSFSQLFAPLIEPELVFILTEDLTVDASDEEILKSIKVAPGIEIPDAHYIDWFPNFTLGDLISDNTASGLVAVGEAADPVSYKDFEKITLKLSHNDEEIATGVSSDVLDNPIESLKWLIRKLDTQGKQLHKGEIVSSGTFVPPVPAKEGTYKAEYSYPGAIQVTFKP